MASIPVSVFGAVRTVFPAWLGQCQDSFLVLLVSRSAGFGFITASASVLLVLGLQLSFGQIEGSFWLVWSSVLRCFSSKR